MWRAPTTGQGQCGVRNLKASRLVGFLIWFPWVCSQVEPVAAVVDLTVLMPGQRYPTFLAQPAPLAPCPREGVLWPSHDHRRSFVPP